MATQVDKIKEDAKKHWLPLADINAAVPAMKARGVSKVARGEQASKVTGSGFLDAYKYAQGIPQTMHDLMATPNQSWADRRLSFVARHMAQVLSRGENLYTKDGTPSGRHLALIAWAYTPDPEGVGAWLRSLRAPKKNGTPWNPWKKTHRPGSEVQTLLFARPKWKMSEARDWLRKHGFTGLGVDAKPHNLRFRQRPTTDFQPKTFRTIPFGEDSGIQAVVGIPYADT